ncbi:hypothetical protein [Enterococcus hermanniensis]|uniref:hypothetical protein n=1 Tax=Enterococcus hermanniensis TaxID=249189 RepID=UPI00090048BD|nr:hypothetical protein [Enterococcus hermanniensis]
MKQESIVQSNNELLNDKRVLMVNPKDEVSVKTIKTDSRGYTRLIDQYCSNHFGKSFTFKDFNNWLVNRGIKVVQNNGTTALTQAIFVSYISYHYILTKNYRQDKEVGLEIIMNIEDKIRSNNKH